MRRKEYEEKTKLFNQRYEKLKKNNLPTPFWDEERRTLEYVYFGHSRYNEGLRVFDNILYALEDVTLAGFYYSFNHAFTKTYEKDGKLVTEKYDGHSHDHSFEGVVRSLYDYPESFNIIPDDEKYYSEQELKYLRCVQNYLLLIGLKDIEDYKAPVSRYRNKLRKKYENAYIRKYENDYLKMVLSGEINFDFCSYNKYVEIKNYKPKENVALIVDEEGNFRLFVEYTKSEIKNYESIKKYYKADLKDDDKIIVNYFKILEKF